MMTGHDADDSTELLRELRARIEGAAAEIDRLAAELQDRDRLVDELESTLDAVLGLSAVPVVVIGDDRRIRAVTRGASQRLEGGDVIGKPLSSVLPEAEFAAVEERVGHPREAGPSAPDASSAEVQVLALPSGGAVVVLPDR
jgi:nitrogen fixation/metabolism regulation signal transduction histidine kinase